MPRYDMNMLFFCSPSFRWYHARVLSHLRILATPHGARQSGTLLIASSLARFCFLRYPLPRRHLVDALTNCDHLLEVGGYAQA